MGMVVNLGNDPELERFMRPPILIHQTLMLLTDYKKQDYIHVNWVADIL